MRVFKNIPCCNISGCDSRVRPSERRLGRDGALTHFDRLGFLLALPQRGDRRGDVLGRYRFNRLSV
jgi:hypothetical protein